MDDELPPLPDFLNRKLWTKEIWQRSHDAYAKAYAQQMVEKAAIAARAREAKEAKKAKEAMDAKRREERLLVKERREKKRMAQEAVLRAIRLELDKGPVSLRGLRQVVAEDKKKLVPWALRTMLKTGEAKKVSRQMYQRNKKHA